MRFQIASSGDNRNFQKKLKKAEGSRMTKSSSVPEGGADFPAAGQCPTLAGIVFRAAGKSGNDFPAASTFAGKPFQQGNSDSHSLLEFSEIWVHQEFGTRLGGSLTPRRVSKSDGLQSWWLSKLATLVHQQLWYLFGWFRMVRYPPLVLSFTQAHLCNTRFCNVSRDACAIPHKNKHERAFAILSLQASLDLEGIAVGPLSQEKRRRKAPSKVAWYVCLLPWGMSLAGNFYYLFAQRTWPCHFLKFITHIKLYFLGITATAFTGLPN